MTLRGTGFGPTDPACAVLFDGRYSPDYEAGSAPGLICGVIQINMVVPGYAEWASTIVGNIWATIAVK